MTNVQEVRMVKGRSETGANLVTGCVTVAILYYSVNPTAFTRHRDFVQERWQAVLHGISVRQAVLAIRSLPETRRP